MKNYNSQLNSKLPDVGESIFATMTKMAADHNAINLSQGFPDFNCSEELLERVAFYQIKGFNQYAPMPGVLGLRKKISSKTEKLYGRKYNPESEIVVTAGGTQALYTAITAIVSAGDEVIIFEPAYDSYAPAVKLNDGIPVYIPLNQGDYSINWDIVEKSITNKTKLIILNSPHNPSGSILSMDDITALEKIVAGKNIFLISDEVYEHIIFDDNTHYSFCSSPLLSERTFVISSFGKTFHTTGWKVGYCVAPEKLMIEFKKVHQFIVFAVNTPIQYAYADILDNENMYLDLNRFYQSKRDLMISLLNNSRFKLRPALGTYFQLLDYSAISDINDRAFSEFLTKEKGVAVIPLSPFYSNGSKNKVIRICFAKKDEVLHQAAEKLCNV
jgi:methionine aminotransferase